MAAAGALAAPANAAVPFKEIVSAAGPLTSVALGDELSCQVAYRNDARFELFPSAAKPGDCGTLVFAAGTLFAPNFSAHDGSAASGIGPIDAVHARLPDGGHRHGHRRQPVQGHDGRRRRRERRAHHAGRLLHRRPGVLPHRHHGPEHRRRAVDGILYRGGDCYLQENDTGFGFLDAAVGAVGCSINANNSPAGRIEQWYPITAGNQYMQGRYGDVWAQIGTHAPLPNTTRATESLDNGAAISWNFSVAAGAQATYAHYTTFSPTGVTGPPPAAAGPAADPPSIAFGPNGLLSTPTNLRCVSKRYFPIRLRKKFWPSIAAVTVKMPRTTQVLRRRPWGTNVDLRGLPKGTFIVRITALTTTGKTIRGTRKYRTCRGRLRGGVPPL